MLSTLLLAGALLSLPFRSGGVVGLSRTDHSQHQGELSFFRFRDFVPRGGNATIGSGGSAPREARGFQFHVHNDDIIVHLEFTVPMVEIPVQRSVAFARTALRNLVNLNVSSLLFSAAILGIGGLIFALLKALSTPVVYSAGYYAAGKKQARVNGALRSDHLVREHLVDALEARLHSHNIDAAACLQQTVCHYFRQAQDDAPNSHWRSILDGVVNLHEMQSLVSGSPLQRAIRAARRDDGRSCGSLAGDCRWLGTAHGLARILSKYLA